VSPEKSVNNQLETKNQQAQKGAHRTVDRLRIDAAAYGSTIVLVVGIIITAIFQPVFLTVSNIANVLSQIAVLGILTMAQTIVLISGGIDLSVGSNVALSGVAAGLLFMHGVPLWIDCIAALGCATVIGLINGLLIAQNRAHPFIITLGMLTLLEGIAELITGGSPVNDMGALATTLGGTIFFGIPTAVVLLFVIVVLTALFLARTPLGRAAYAIGGNEEASYLSGIPIKRTKTCCTAMTRACYRKWPGLNRSI
jgi:ribose/xylose/arabinose/galactoside ABC-type transport system permease subunit